MINMKVIGCGAAGNKAVSQFVEDKFIEAENVLLLNSNMEDIPTEYRTRALIYGEGSYGGSGKDRTIGKKLLITDMKKTEFIKNIDNFCNDTTTDVFVIVGSAEGGSGSSALPLLANYIKQVIGKTVICGIFFGFEEDVRGLENSVSICKDLADNIGVIGVSNKKFLNNSNSNKTTAEMKANVYLEEALTVLSGKTIFPSYQNIDKTDLMKIISTPGYITVTMCPITKDIKNRTQYDATINLAVDEAKYLDNANRKKCARIGVIFDLNDIEETYVDLSSSVLKERFGVPYEYFTHVQNKSKEMTDEYVTWIVSGQELPVEEIKGLYDKYKATSSMIDKDKSAFFAEIGGLDVGENNGLFNVLTEKKDETSVADKKKGFFGSLEDSLY